MHKATVVTDVTFGDAGKGSITDALVRQGAQLVVRYNGGAQAAHTVMTTDWKHHIFHQFGSGTLVDGVETFLSRHMLVNPLALYQENEELQTIGIRNALSRMHIDSRALVTTPYQVIANRLRELARGANKHGSCGMGIGETASDALSNPESVLRFGDLLNDATLSCKLKWHRDQKRHQLDALLPQLHLLPKHLFFETALPLLDQLHSEDELDAAHEVFSFVASQVHTENPEFLASRMQRTGATIFEGAQGVLLDEDWGLHPHTTWSKTTSANALQLINETGADVQTTVLGLTRAYQTRHGVGPLPTETEALTRALTEPDNPTNDWQGPFRAGWLDLCLLNYAIKANRGIDGLVITCLDRLTELPEVKVATAYTYNSAPWAPHPDFASLQQRELEGRLLSEVEVTYTPLSTEPNAYASEISKKLQIPWLGSSFGPTADDKEMNC